MWNKAKEWWGYLRFRLNPYRDLGAQMEGPLAKLLGALAPMRAEGVSKIRMGGAHDGGYVMLDDFRGIGGAYSLGIGPNVSWDLAMAQRKIPVWQYDYTVPGPPRDHPLFTFRSLRIGAQDDPGTRTVSLSSLIKTNRHEAADLILKIDIDGAEWEVFAGIDPDRLKIFRQILVEFHLLDHVADPAWREQAMKALGHLNRHHQVVHVHGNNLAAIAVAGGIKVPDSLEVTFARRDAYRLAATEETFPGPFDRPNSLVFPDFPLGRFKFGSG